MSKKSFWNGAGGAILQMAVVSVLSIVVYHLSVGRQAEAAPAKKVTEIVVVDTQALLEAQIELTTAQIAGGTEFSEEQLKMTGQNFGTQLLRTLKEYRDRGVLVIDRRHALAIPVGSDVTAEVGGKLGVKVKPSPDPFSAPALQ